MNNFTKSFQTLKCLRECPNFFVSLIMSSLFGVLEIQYVNDLSKKNYNFVLFYFSCFGKVVFFRLLVRLFFA